MIRADASYHRETMRASAQRVQAFRHIVKVRDHRMGVDEPGTKGGDDTGPSKGWDVGDLEVVCEYAPAERGCPTRFSLVLRFPAGLSDEQVAKLKIIAAKCPVHRTLDGEVMFDERVERLALASS
jgi:putative redox protein